MAWNLHADVSWSPSEIITLWSRLSIFWFWRYFDLVKWVMLCGFSSLWCLLDWNWSYLGLLGIIWRRCKCWGEERRHISDALRQVLSSLKHKTSNVTTVTCHNHNNFGKFYCTVVTALLRLWQFDLYFSNTYMINNQSVFALVIMRFCYKLSFYHVYEVNQPHTLRIQRCLCKVMSPP